MAQVDFLNYFPLFFWFIICFFIFYFLNFCYFLPFVFNSLSVRSLYFCEIVNNALVYNFFFEIFQFFYQHLFFHFMSLNLIALKFYKIDLFIFSVNNLLKLH